jgi:NDP-sugar pyrophosphorylase family protein
MAKSPYNEQDAAEHLKSVNLVSLDDFEHHQLFEEKVEFIWDALKLLKAHIESWLDEHGAGLQGQISPDAYLVNREQIHVGEGSIIEPGAYVKGPAIIGRNCVIRHGAYLRGQVLMGDGALLGHASEAKNTIFLNNAKAPHFNYVGDSILGNDVNLGAGSRLSNLPVTSVKDPETGKRPTIDIQVGEDIFDTELAKLGAILGDGVETGCNCVLNPGCIVGRETLIYPNISLRKGYYAAHRIVKLRQDLEIVRRV